MLIHSAQKGYSTLLAVLLLALMLALLLAPMMFIARFQARQAVSSVSSQRAYFEAEGALLATIKQLEQSPASTVVQDGISSYQVGDAVITREVVTDPILGTRTIAVTADIDGYKRKLVADVIKETVVNIDDSTERGPLDIVFVLDFSGSMGFDDSDHLINEWGYIPVDVLKQAVKDFVYSSQFSDQDRIGIVTYAKEAEVQRELDFVSDKASFASVLDPLSPSGGTNVAQGVAYAVDVLHSAPARSDGSRAGKVIISFTDGEPGHAVQRSSGSQSSSYYDCEKSRSNKPEYNCPPDGCKPYVPADGQYGNECTDISIDTATLAKNQNISIYSVIFLNPLFVSDTITKAEFTGNEPELFLAKEMMKVMASDNQYTETIDIATISDIFQNIQTTVTQKAVSIREVEPN